MQPVAVASTAAAAAAVSSAMAIAATEPSTTEQATRRTDDAFQFPLILISHLSLDLQVQRHPK